MNVVLTGCAGFVGSRILDLILDVTDWSVVGIDNLSTGKLKNIAQHLYKSRFRFVEANILNKGDMASIFRTEKPNAVCHQAAQASLLASHQRPDFDAQVNIVGTVRLMKLAERYNAKFVFASTSAVFSSLVTVANEAETCEPERPYGIAKRAAEMYLMNSTTPVAILRYGNVYGPRQIPIGENQLIARLMSHIYTGTPFRVYGSGSHKRDFIYVTDVARANVMALANPITGILHVGTGHAHSVSEIIETTLALCGKENLELEHTGAVREPETITITTIRTDWKELWKAKTELQDGISKTIAWWRERTSCNE